MKNPRLTRIGPVEEAGNFSDVLKALVIDVTLFLEFFGIFPG
jgi:hypothetical protein